jgi:hypothetical protein
MRKLFDEAAKRTQGTQKKLSTYDHRALFDPLEEY